MRKLKLFLLKLLDRMDESSTIRGVVVLAIMVGGYAVSPENIDSITAVAVAVGAALKAVFPDNLK